jgi:hypothetical protein
MADPTQAHQEPPGNPKPLLFFTALPGEGHTYPLLTIASSMIQHGYPVVFHGGAQFEADILAMGAEFSPIPSMLDPVPDPEAVVAAGKAITDCGVPLFVHGLVNFLYTPCPSGPSSSKRPSSSSKNATQPVRSSSSTSSAA